MLVLGIDPGTRNLGWGLVRGEGNRLFHVAHGVLRVKESLPLSTRLVQLEAGLVQLLEGHSPVVGSVESLFFHKDAQAASKLGHARGVVLLVLERAGIQLAEYAPARVKQTLTGGGRAEKIQVAQMIKMLLNLPELPAADAADALALAVTHLRRAPIDARLGERSLPAALVKKGVVGRGRRRAPSKTALAALLERSTRRSV
jgi:crossover junction endodeoxyribonuclease RuvC